MTRYFSTFIKINKKKYLYMHLGIKMMMKISRLLREETDIFVMYVTLIILAILLFISFILDLRGIEITPKISLLAIVSGLIPVFITTVFVLRKNRSIAEEIFKKVEDIKYKYPGEIIKGSEKCIIEITNALRDAEESIGENIFIERAMPMEFTEEIYPSSIKEKEYLKENLHYYKERVRSIIVEGKGNFDRTIYGRTNNRDIDKATSKFIEDLYFKESPDTSEVGIYPEWHGITLFLIGESSTSIKIEKWHYGFLLFGERITPDSGFKTTNEELIKLFDNLWRWLKNCCGDNYWDLWQSKDKRHEIKKKIQDFLVM